LAISIGKPARKFSRSSGDNAPNPGLRRIAAARVENLADHSLFVGHEGVSGMSGPAPEDVIVSDDHLGLRRHPYLGATQSFARRFIEVGFEANLLLQQSRGKREHDMSCHKLDNVVAGDKCQSDIVPAIADGNQNMAEMGEVRRQIGGQRIDKLRHAALMPAGALLNLFFVNALRRFVGIAEMQHGTVVVLGHVGEPQFGDETLY
jgi:hypothetical protein